MKGLYSRGLIFGILRYMIKHTYISTYIHTHSCCYKQWQVIGRIGRVGVPVLQTHHTRVFREPKEEVEHVATPHPVMEGVIVREMFHQSGLVTHPVVLEVGEKHQ